MLYTVLNFEGADCMCSFGFLSIGLWPAFAL